MKILIDINHPAHVHYFRNFINLMGEKGHNVIVTNRDSEIINSLLDLYKIKHIIRNKRPKKNTVIASSFYLLKVIYHIIIVSVRYKPDFYLGFGSFPCTLVAELFRKPVLILDDTEHNNLNHFLLSLLKPVILTPYYYKKKLWKNQIFVNSFVEQLYLHSNHYNFKKKVRRKYALIRYISFDARHDKGVVPLSLNFKKKIVRELTKYMDVYIVCENNNYSCFNKYKLDIKPNEIHEYIHDAYLLITEGATMASEAGILGTPYIYINPLQNMGNIDEQISKFPFVAKKSVDENEIISMIKHIIENNEDNHKKHNVLRELEKNTIDFTAFLIWFVEFYPQSVKILKKNPNYQNRFIKNEIS